MEFSATMPCRTIITVPVVLAAGILFGLSIFWGLWGAAALIGFVIWIPTWAIAINKKAWVRVENEQIAWASIWPWDSGQTVPLANILAIEVNLDEPSEIGLRMWNGDFKGVLFYWSRRQAEFLAAITAQRPELLIEKKQRGRT